MNAKGIVLKIFGVVLVVAIATLLISSVVIGIMGLGQPIESGTYTGQVIDYSHQRGFIFQTNDLTTKTHERSSAREDWAVPDNNPELVQKVRSIEEGDRVEIEYYRPLWVWPDVADNSMKHIEEIRVANNTST